MKLLQLKLKFDTVGFWMVTRSNREQVKERVNSKFFQIY